MNKIRLLSLNVRGINDVRKRNKTFMWIKNQKPDIVVLQETFCTESVKNSLDETCKNFDFIAEHSVTNSPHFRASLRKAENVVDEEEDVAASALLIAVAEVLRHGQTRESHTCTCTWRLVHLTKYEGCF